MKVCIILCLLALGGSTLDAPKSGNELDIRSASECKSVAAIISILSQHKAPATSFCSSFISIPVKTATSTDVHTICPSLDIREVLTFAGRNTGVKDFDSDTNEDNNPKDVCHDWFGT